MKKIVILMLLFLTTIAYSQVPHKTRENLELSKADNVTHIDTILGQTSADKIVKYITYQQFLAQLVASGFGEGGSGDVTKVGTPVNNQFAIWTGNGTIEGDPDIVYNQSTNSMSLSDATNNPSSNYWNTTSGAISFIGASTLYIDSGIGNERIGLDGGTSRLYFRDDIFLTYLDFIAPTANRTINLPDADGTLPLIESPNIWTNFNVFRNDLSIGNNLPINFIIDDNNAINTVFNFTNGVTTFSPAGISELILESSGITTPNLSISEINTKGSKSLITKEYADANYGGGTNLLPLNNVWTGVNTFSERVLIGKNDALDYSLERAQEGVNTSPKIIFQGGSGNDSNILLRVGNDGGDLGAFNDALLVDANPSAPNSTTGGIDGVGAKALITKEYGDLNYSGGGTGHTIQDEGTSLTNRTNLDFVGAGVTVTDDLANDKTIVTISTVAGATNPNIFIPTSTADLSNVANDGKIADIQSDITLTANLTLAPNLYLRFSGGTIILDGFTLTGDNTEILVDSDKLMIVANLPTDIINGTWFTQYDLFFTNIGGKGDYEEVTDGAITAAGNTLTSATIGFTVNDIGKSFALADAGAVGSNASTLIGTITGYTNATTVTTSLNATSTVSAKVLMLGSDNYQGGINFLYLRNQRGGKGHYPEGKYFTSVVEMVNSQAGTLNYEGWRIGDGTDDIKIIGHNASIHVIPNAIDRNHLFTLFDTKRYSVKGLKLVGDYRYHINTTEFPSLINIGTGAYDGQMNDLDISQSIGDGLVTIADGQFQTFLDGTNFTVGNVDSAGVIQAGETNWVYSDIIDVSSGGFVTSGDERGYRYFAVTGTSFGGWSGLMRQDYFVAYYDATDTFIIKSPKQQIYGQIRLEPTWKKVRVMFRDVADKALIDIQIRPSRHARGLLMNNVNVSFNGRQGASNLPYDTTWENSNIFENGDVSPGAGIDIEDERRSAENYTFRNLRMWNNYGGDIIIVGARNVHIDFCKLLPNTKPNWNVQADNVNFVGLSLAFGRDVRATNNIIFNRGNSIDRAAVWDSNTMHSGRLSTTSNGCEVTNNKMHNARLHVDWQSTANRTQSLIKGNIWFIDENWDTDGTGYLITDRRQGGQFIDNEIRINDISYMSNIATNQDAKVDFDWTATYYLFEPLGSDNGTEYGGYIEGFRLTGSYIYDTEHSDTSTRFIMPVQDNNIDLIEGAVDYKYGESKNITMEGGKIRGWLSFNLTDWSGVDSGDANTIIIKNREIIVEDGDFAYTNTGVNLLRTYPKDANFEFYECKFIVKPIFSVFASSQKFIRLEHFGTTLMDNCYYETADAKDFDLSNTSVLSALSGKVTIIDPKVKNVTIIKGTGNDLLYTKANPNLEIYADNTAALAGGIPVGYMYRTATGTVNIVY